MFRKLISNLPFSPSLIDQVALYAKQLRRTSRVRVIGLALITTAVMIQFLGNLLVAPSSALKSPVQSQEVLGVSTAYTTAKYKHNNLAAIIHSQQANDLNSKTVTGWHLPQVSPMTGLATSFSFIVLAGFFYSRERLMAKELNMVKTDITDSGGV